MEKEKYGKSEWEEITWKEQRKVQRGKDEGELVIKTE
jgi:hypothetical protein